MSPAASTRRLTSRDLLRFQMADDPHVSPDGTQVAWVRTWMDPKENRYRSNIVVTTITNGATRQLTAGDGLDTHPRWSPDGRFVAYLATPGPRAADSANGSPAAALAPAVSVVGNGPQLMVVVAEGGEPRRLTSLKGGVYEPVWSPDGRRLAFTTFVDPARGLESLGAGEPGEDDLYARFNRDVLIVRRLRWKADGAGFFGDYRRQVAWIPFDEDGSEPSPVLLTCGEFELVAPAWSPDGRRLAAVGNLRPDGEAVRSSFIYILDAEGQAPVQPQELFGLQEMRSTDLSWSPDGTTIAVCGHNDPVIGHYGNQRLWLVSVADGSATCATEWLDRTLGDYSRNADMRRYGGADGPRWLPNGSGLLVLVNEAGTVQLTRLSLTENSATPLTEGDHAVVAFSTDARGETIVVLVGEDLNPGDLYRLEPQTGGPAALRRLTSVNGALLAELELSPSHRFQVQSGDVTIDAWMVPPVGYEPGRKYPIILYTGGGPGGMRASVFCHEFQLYAAHGYAVVHCNTRGNHGYGEAFSVATRGAWGDLDYEDNMACLRAACEQFDFVDPSRLAVAGGSYGGYSATWIISRHPEFKAAVVDRCLFNRYSFNGTSDIGFLLDQIEFDKQLPWERTESYIHRSPMQHIGGVRTPTLVVHSEQDHRCPVEQGEQLFMALKRLGVPTEFVRFPNETHDLSRSGRPWHRVYRLDRYLDWFARWL